MKETNRPWGIHTIRDIIGSTECQTDDPIFGYIRAVPEPYTGNRIVAAWWVLAGRAFAIIWPKAGELAAAMGVRAYKKPWPSEGERAARAAAASAHLPKPDASRVTHFSDEDIEALRAAFRTRFNEDVPRTETLFHVASIGYRMALRDLAANNN